MNPQPGRTRTGAGGELLAQLSCSLGGATLDVAWQDRWGTTSAGTDETARAAARQDVMADAAAAVFGMAKQEEEAAAAAA